MRCSVKWCDRSDIKLKGRALCKRHASQHYQVGKIITTRNDLNRQPIVEGPITKIPLYNKDKEFIDYAIIDSEDTSLLDIGVWYASYGYAQAFHRTEKRFYRLHRHVLGIGGAKKPIVDHINGNRLDCRKSNLRIVSPLQNALNRTHSLSSKIKFKGVFDDNSYRRHTLKKPYRSKIRLNGVVYEIGRFSTAEEAAWMYDQWATQLFGEFARLNFEYM